MSANASDMREVSVTHNLNFLCNRVVFTRGGKGLYIIFGTQAIKDGATLIKFKFP